MVYQRITAWKERQQNPVIAWDWKMAKRCAKETPLPLERELILIPLLKLGDGKHSSPSGIDCQRMHIVLRQTLQASTGL